ncbi:hypothetical protein BDP55DRAFT_635035 [Colletotrichum godetiae]|uniref:Uncharacterized protein n=1 Tax=Colletotrichum godetiae TaxID=1209918 RepID=A0AAJ0EQ14_9PEZI|nr:uncharacterized protein BDP55DRAFT_635035 [Colletotrichum godetiae]KAK1672291.1 hypothetical protein BDP55DRAFT_635035 [Colletotrichum godetiae]
MNQAPSDSTEDSKGRPLVERVGTQGYVHIHVLHKHTHQTVNGELKSPESHAPPSSPTSKKCPAPCKQTSRAKSFTYHPPSRGRPPMRSQYPPSQISIPPTSNSPKTRNLTSPLVPSSPSSMHTKPCMNHKTPFPAIPTSSEKETPGMTQAFTSNSIKLQKSNKIRRTTNRLTRTGDEMMCTSHMVRKASTIPALCRHRPTNILVPSTHAHIKSTTTSINLSKIQGPNSKGPTLEKAWSGPLPNLPAVTLRPPRVDFFWGISHHAP